MKLFVFFLVIAFDLAYIAVSAHAIAPIPEKTGFSGFANVGVGIMNFKTNMIAGSDLGDTGDNSIDNITDSPGSKTKATPVLNFEATYTFADTRTQIFVGNLLEDLVRYDTSTVAGIRQELPDKSILSLAYVFTSFPTSVWEDPYVVNTEREETDRTADGMRLGFDKILGTDFEMNFTWRDIAIGDELSGQTQLVGNNTITSAETGLMDRNGNSYIGKFTYPFFFKEKRHILIPTISYSIYDLDGSAMAFDQYGILGSYVFNHPKFSLITNLYYALSDFDKENPIYDKTQEDDIYGVTISGFYRNFLGVPKMNLVGTIATYERDSNINFYDTQVTMGTVSVLYRF